MNINSKKNKLLIIGAGGHGKVVYDAAKKSEKYDSISFIDDKLNIGDQILSSEVIGNMKSLRKYKKTHKFFVAIGDNKQREKITKVLMEQEYIVATIIHPNSIISENVKIGKGTVVMAGSVINCDTKIGVGCILNTSSSVDHDCAISDFVHISPNACVAGNVKIGHSTWVGASATIINNLSVGNNCIIGASSLVIKNLDDYFIGKGIPIERLR